MNHQKSDILQLLQSPDQSNQKLGLILYESQGCSQAKDWFDGLNQIYKIANDKKAESKDQLIDFFNKKILSLSSKKLFDLPKSIGLLLNLEWLYLSNNNLTILPETIGNLINLEELWLRSNKLTTLSKTVGNLTKLRELQLYNNDLEYLPESIGKLENLYELDLHYNKLTNLPSSITNLKSLTTLCVYGNSISEDKLKIIKSILPDKCEIIGLSSKSQF